MPWQPAPPLPEIEVDAARVWAESGCQSLTHPDVPVPSRLVRTVAAVVARLDAAGAGLAERYGACGLGALSERAGSLLFQPAGRASCGGATRLLRAADGWIAVTLARPDDRRALPAWLGVDPDSTFVVTNSDPWVEVARRVGERRSAELVDLATLLGLACAVVGETAPTAGVILAHLGDAAPSPLAGLRVANLASLWAGPLAADVLARLGADVAFVESTTRPDGARGDADMVRRHAHRAALRRCRFPHRHRCRPAELVGGSGRRRDRGIPTRAPSNSWASRPRTSCRVVLECGCRSRATARGPSEANRVGFGDDAAAAGGLVGVAEGGPVFIADAIADPITGLVAASTIVDLIGAGGRWVVDVALARVAAAVAQRVSDPVALASHRPAPPRRIAPAAAVPLGDDTDAVIEEWTRR